MAEHRRPRRAASASVPADLEAEVAELIEAFEGPLYWPDVAPEQAKGAWGELWSWVTGAVMRFSWDSHVLPSCWFRHHHLVEALVALRDHERGFYAPTAPPTAAVEFHRALRDIESRLRSWSAELRCEATHDPSHDQPRRLSDEGFEDFVSTDLEARRTRGPEAQPALSRPEPPLTPPTAKETRHLGPDG